MTSTVLCNSILSCRVLCVSHLQFLHSSDFFYDHFKGARKRTPPHYPRWSLWVRYHVSTMYEWSSSFCLSPPPSTPLPFNLECIGTQEQKQWWEAADIVTKACFSHFHWTLIFPCPIHHFSPFLWFFHSSSLPPFFSKFINLFLSPPHPLSLPFLPTA